MSDGESAPAARLRAALKSAALPASVRRAWSAPPPSPAPGQIWRARWGRATQLMLIQDTPFRSVRAAPITLNVDAADEEATVLAPECSELTVPLVVWQSYATNVPLRVLDRFLGSVTLELPELPTANHARPVLTPADERAVHRARLQDTLDVFVTARWAPGGAGNLKTLLSAVDRKSLGQALGVNDRMVIALSRGKAALNPDQAERLAPLVNQPVEALLAANPSLPEDLVAELDHPAYRAKVVALAHRRGIDELEAWLTAGFAVSAVAHRRTEGDAPLWTDRLDRYFALVLDDELRADEPGCSARPGAGHACRPRLRVARSARRLGP